MESEESAPESGKEVEAPLWALQPIKEYIRRMEQLGKLTGLAMKGIATMEAWPVMIKLADYAGLSEVAVEKYPELKDKREELLEKSEEDAELANQEYERGFPLIHGQGVISLWGMLESAIREFVANWIANHPAAYEFDAVSELEIEIGIYEELDSDERSYYLTNLLEDEVGARYKGGKDRFESMLEPFGVSGNVPDDLGKKLYEMQKVRNVLVHNNGVADHKLVDQCPWLDLETGEEILLSHDEFNEYGETASKYLYLVFNRVRKHFMTGDETEQPLSFSSRLEP